ncbi:hypothetical protein SM11_chr3642 [Sinorhizobium meliloti SM11]|uniref:Uncharacterized protein n=1 Tax=Sinorhizobium meliloti (strain SM11) TaxID=707241 RepID=F7X3T4_SINMM|nr:hypothetical protein SM11_chr3642 [Sinorhizobium meliloti SM11]
MIVGIPGISAACGSLTAFEKTHNAVASSKWPENRY